MRPLMAARLAWSAESMPSSSMKSLFAVALVLAAIGSAAASDAGVSVTPPARPIAAERSVNEWLMRLHDASRNRSYVGTFVVSSAEGALSSARIWHACDGENQIEQVESLTGEPRMTFRKNDEVVTYLRDSKIARAEKRESLSIFPGLLRAPDSAIADFYAAKMVGQERVAGLDTDVLLLQPKDKLRFGYRIWSEKKSGLVVKLQTVGLDGAVMEQAAFSELQLDAPVSVGKLARQMEKMQGYRLEKAEMKKTTAIAEGWMLSSPVAGFAPMSCLQRAALPAGSAEPGKTMQWVFSDGLASVSLFVEAFDGGRHQREGVQAMAATHSLTQRMGAWWLTAVGEVPPQTLKAFATKLERIKQDPK